MLSRRFLSSLASAITILILLSIASPLTQAVSAAPAEGVAPVEMTKDGAPGADLANKVVGQVRFWLAFAWGMMGLKWLLVAILVVALLCRMNRVRKESSKPKTE